MQTLRVIVERDAEVGFVAQCIDYDIIGLAPDVDAALNNFVRAFIRHVVVAVSVVPPQGDYRSRFEAAADRQPLRSFEIPHFTVGEAGSFDDSDLPHRGTALVA